MKSINVFKLAVIVGVLGYALGAKAGDLTTETIVEESVYQALHVIDSAQTVQIARNEPRYWEVNSAWAIGKYPSERKVIGYMALDAVGHALVTATLVKFNAPSWAVRTWELVTIADTANCVRGNFKIGLQAKF